MQKTINESISNIRNIGINPNIIILTQKNYIDFIHEIKEPLCFQYKEENSDKDEYGIELKYAGINIAVLNKYDVLYNTLNVSCIGTIPIVRAITYEIIEKGRLFNLITLKEIIWDIKYQ